MTQVDQVDFDYLNQFNWSYQSGYARTWGPRPQRLCIFMQNVVAWRMGLDGKIDHKDRDGLNNQRSNLRVATPSQNAANSQLHSGYRGVTWSQSSNKWRVRIIHNYREINLGHYADLTEAALAYNKKALELFGEFATLNVIRVPDYSSSAYQSFED